MNRTYILTASKCRQIQVNYLLNLRNEFKYPMAVNIIKYDDILLFTFNAQAVNQLSPYAGFRLPPIQICEPFAKQTNGKVAKHPVS